MKKPELVNVVKTKADIIRELEVCREQFLLHANSQVEANLKRREEFAASIATAVRNPISSELGRILSWSEAVVSNEQETVVLQTTVQKLSELPDYNSVYKHLKDMRDEWQERAEMSFGRSSSVFSNAVDMAQHEGTISALRTIRSWIRFMERRIALINSL